MDLFFISCPLVVTQAPTRCVTDMRRPVTALDRKRAAGSQLVANLAVAAMGRTALRAMEAEWPLWEAQRAAEHSCQLCALRANKLQPPNDVIHDLPTRDCSLPTHRHCGASCIDIRAVFYVPQGGVAPPGIIPPLTPTRLH